VDAHSVGLEGDLFKVDAHSVHLDGGPFALRHPEDTSEETLVGHI